MAEARMSGDALDELEDDDWEDVDEDDSDPLPDSPNPGDIEDLVADPPGSAPDALELPSYINRLVPETDEDDPYQCDPPPASSLPMPADLHPNGAVYLVYLMVVWLHTQFKVPFRACNVILAICATIFTLSAVDLAPAMFSTLDSVLGAMEVEPTFYILPVCPQCKMPHPASTTPDTLCVRCSGLLFNTIPTVGQQRRGRSTRAKPVPLLRFPYKPLEHQLIDIIPEIEDQLDTWRLKAREDGVYTDQFDGQISKELEDHEGAPFFRHDLQEMPDGELRLGITLGVDWCVLQFTVQYFPTT